LSSIGCPKVLQQHIFPLYFNSSLTLVQSSFPLFGAALGTAVLDCPSKALAYFAPFDVVRGDVMTVKALGPNGTSHRLTFGSNFKIESVLFMAQKAFNIPHKCEL
jgi:hypothetical protein